MRNLKKVLSLSLAFVMLLGMMVVGAGAKTALDVYPDKGDITYKEAVDLLTAIDVLQGDDGGFRPTDTLTREQAAKIVATVALGVDAAEALSVTKAPFTDVAATRWSAGYIAYCANVGIINGMGDGTYRPTDEVTGYQFAKMLLCVVGYGANDEYVGSNWSLAVAKDGVTTGLFDRLSNVSNTAATREEAAQLAFNALNLNMVAYSALYGTYSAYTSTYGNQQLLGTKANKIFNVEFRLVDDAYGYQFREWKYINTSKAITDQYLVDTIVNTVTSTGTKLGEIFKNNDWEDTFNIIENGIDLGAPAKSGTARFGGLTFTNDSASVLYDFPTINLKNSNANVITYAGQTVVLVDSYKPVYSNGVMTGYACDGDVDKVIVATDYLAEVTKVNAATASTDESVDLKVYVPNATANFGTVSATKVPAEGFTKGDYVLVTPHMILDAIEGAVIDHATNVDKADVAAACVDRLEITAAEVLDGTVYAYYLNTAGQTNGSVSIASTKYNYNGVQIDKDALGYAIATEDGYGLRSSTYNFYLDKTGNVAGIVEVESTIGDYAYILAVGEDSFKMDNDIKVLLSDGTVGTYTVSPKSGESNYANKDANHTTASGTKLYDSTRSTLNSTDGANHDGMAEYVGYIYSYSIEGSEIVLNTLTDKYGHPANAHTVKSDGATPTDDVFHKTTTDSFTQKYAALSYVDKDGGNPGVVYATDTTVFCYIDGGKVTTFVGKDNAPSIITENMPLAIATRTIGNTVYATFVVINGAPETGVSDNYFYITGARFGYGKEASTGNRVYFYPVIKDGEAVNIAIDKDNLTVGAYAYGYSDKAFTNDTGYTVENGVYNTKALVAGKGYNEGVISVSTNANVISISNLADPAGNTAQFAIDPNCVIVDLTTTPFTFDADFAVGDPVSVVYKTVGNNNYIETMYITGANKAAVAVVDPALDDAGKNYVSTSTVVEATSGIYAGAFDVEISSTLTTGNDLLACVTSTDANATTALYNDTGLTNQETTSALTGLKADAPTTYYLVVSTVGGAVKNVYEVNVTTDIPALSVAKNDSTASSKISSNSISGTTASTTVDNGTTLTELMTGFVPTTGATATLYSDNNCTTPVTGPFSTGGPTNYYLQVSMAGYHTVVYTIGLTVSA